MAHRQDSIRVRCILPDGNGDHSFATFGSADVDTSDARVRKWRMQDLSDQHAGHTEVVGVLARAGSFLGRVDHRGGLADNGVVVTHLVIPSKARNPRLAWRLTWQALQPRALHQPPSESLHTSGCNLCSGT